MVKSSLRGRRPFFGRHLLLVFGVLAALIGVLEYADYQQERRNLREEKTRALALLLEARAAELQGWLRERDDAVRAAIRDFRLPLQIPRLRNGGGDAVWTWLEVLRAVQRNSAGFLFDADGHLLLAATGGPASSDLPAELLRLPAAHGDPRMTAVGRSLAVAYPAAEGGRTYGLLVFVVDADRLPIFPASPAGGPQLFLMDAAGAVIQSTGPTALPAQAAVARRPLPGLPWSLAAALDLEPSYTALQVRKLLETGLAVSLVLLAALLVRWGWSRERVRQVTQSEAKFRTLFSEAPIAIALFDPRTGRILESNAALTRLLGHTSEQLGWRCVPELTHPGDAEREAALYRDLLAGVRRSYEIEKRCRRADGSTVWCRFVASLVTSPHGAPEYGIAMLEDFSQRREALEQLRLARNRQRALSRRLLQAQETERQRIALELHDEVAQAFAAVRIHLNGLAAPDDVPDCGPVVREALQRVRDLALHLRPPQLDELGLFPALRAYVARIVRDAGPPVQLEVRGELRRFPQAVEIACFRIAQEALANALRHGEAGRIDLTLDYQADRLVLTVRDDGKGFDAEAVQAKAVQGESMGLLGMEERAALADGELHLATAPGHGTTVAAVFSVAAVAQPLAIP